MEQDLAAAADLIDIAFRSATVWRLRRAPGGAAQGRPGGAGLSAGDHGRQSDYVYGAAKGALGVLVQGIGHRLTRTGARAVVIKSGFIDTPMTAHVPNKGALWANTEAGRSSMPQGSGGW